MYKTKILTLVIAMLTLVSCQNNEIDISIIYTTDVFGFIYPYDYQTDNNSRTSLAHFMTLVKEQRQIYGDDHCLVLDNGNKATGQSSSFYYNFVDTKNEPICYKAERMINYDACGVGFRDTEISSFIHHSRYSPERQPPYICANLIDIKTGKPHFKPYFIKDCDGVKIAVLAMTSPQATRWIPKEDLSNLECEDMIECAQKWIRVIKQQEKPDLIVGLFNCMSEYNQNNYDIDTYKNPNGGVPAVIRVPGFDIALFGGSSMKNERIFRLKNDANEYVQCIQLSQACYSAGTVRVHLKKKGNGYMKRIFGSIVNLKMYEPDEHFCEVFKNSHDSIYNWFNKPIGFLPDTIFGDDGLYGPDKYRKLINDVQMWATKADISLAATTIAHDTIPPGPVTMKRIFKIYPYENNVCIMSMMGEDIRRYLEASVNEQYEQYKNGDTPLLRVKKDRFGHILYTEDSKTYLLSSPDNFFAAGGIKYTIDLTKPEGSRVNIISKTDGTPFELRNTYNVAINSYVARGGDNTFVNWLGWNDETIRIHATQSRPVSIRQYMREYIISHKDTLKISDDSNWHIEPYAWWKNQKELEKQRQDFVWTATYKAIRSREANPHYKK